jgi:hypothetical protein
MKKLALVMLLMLSGSAFAENHQLKPGLWEMKQIRQVLDGQDTAAQMAALRGQMQQALANMSPAQRKQIESRMGSQGVGSGGSTRICISPAMAARNRPMVDPQGRCEPAKLVHSGNSIQFEFNCTANGATNVGSGTSVAEGDTVTTRVDMTVTDARGRHTIQSESQMKYLGPDCQGIKAADQLAK